uniref:Uncharacterized protein n=1 Tax=Magallana gigas TaxID=29159 RepID=K1Q8Y1_MAGGI
MAAPMKKFVPGLSFIKQSVILQNLRKFAVSLPPGSAESRVLAVGRQIANVNYKYHNFKTAYKIWSLSDALPTLKA